MKRNYEYGNPKCLWCGSETVGSIHQVASTSSYFKGDDLFSVEDLVYCVDCGKISALGYWLKDKEEIK